MKILRLQAEGVHGYLSLDIDFLPDLTFLTGLNGCGKTSALRLLMGLLTPSVPQLVGITYESACVTTEVEGQLIAVTSTRTAETLTLSVTGEDDVLRLSAADMQLALEFRADEAVRSPLQRRLGRNKAIARIAGLSTPMFLALDRRSVSAATAEDPELAYRRELEYRRGIRVDRPRRVGMPSSLQDVETLVRDSLNATRAAQEKMDERLRTELLVDAFRYERVGPQMPVDIPNRSVLNDFKRRQAAAETSAARLRLPLGEVQKALTRFFEDMSRTVDVLESARGAPSEKRQDELFGWLMNKAQVDRIVRYVEKLEKYGAQRAELHAPMDRFLSLANGFLEQTGKSLQLSDSDRLLVAIHDEPRARSTHELSSGESQIVIMLAHLSLSRELRESGVFVIDEPELSLHLAWQERFVQAVQDANPRVQLIMATHSPAIILDRVAHVRSLS